MAHQNLFSTLANAVWIESVSDWRNADAFETACRIYEKHYIAVQLAAQLKWKDQKELYTIMAKKSDNKREYAKWRGFVNINLSDADKSAYLAWCKEHANQFDEMLRGFLEDGNKLTISWDTRSKCYMAAAKNDDPEHRNGGLCVTSRSGDVTDAIWLTLYKHYAICDGDWDQHFGGPSIPVWG